jgi:hypothetical protein
MATYKEIFGTNIEVLASDPANPVKDKFGITQRIMWLRVKV